MFKNNRSFWKDMHPRKKRKLEQKEAAKEHLRTLFRQADEAFTEDPSLAHRYVKMARDIQMKHKVRMPREYKRKYCKHCYHYIRTGVNGRVRIRDGVLTVYCENCKKFTRVPFK